MTRFPSPPSDTDADRLRDEAERWWLRLRDVDFTRREAAALREWCARSPAHAHAWREVAQTWQALGPALAAMPAAGAPDVPRRRLFLGAAMAAGAAALVVHPPWQLFPSALDYLADFRTGTAEQREVALSDQLVVQMNTRTRINRLPDAGQAQSLELLAGEAELSVAGPVLLRAQAGLTRADRARLNVRYTGPEVCVTCLAGEAWVEQGGRRQALAAGEQLSYDRQGARAPVPADAAHVSAWRTGTLSFSGQTLAEVIEEINRYRPGRVLLRDSALAAQRVRMRFAITETDMALHMLRDLYGVRLTELPAGIVLLG
ncbi:Sigma factor regulator VreR (cytoplasmic membrane-localized) of trans-envelope signaling system [plant metagenome]|uniref:Sigma factor regulator VreR (Cytoplasmic membrane-localized) of trans-envelope signaling system n=1 Tax=plant metagenome TaxID=1297885 RepID=A0A484VBA5_9ZZZZ